MWKVRHKSISSCSCRQQDFELQQLHCERKSARRRRRSGGNAGGRVATKVRSSSRSDDWKSASTSSVENGKSTTTGGEVVLSRRMWTNSLLASASSLATATTFDATEAKAAPELVSAAWEKLGGGQADIYYPDLFEGNFWFSFDRLSNDVNSLCSTKKI